MKKSKVNHLCPLRHRRPNHCGGTFSNNNNNAIETTTSNHYDKNQYPVTVDNIEKLTTTSEAGTNGRKTWMVIRIVVMKILIIVIQIASIHSVTVLTLVITGALDEVSYVPSLLLGNIFISYEIVIGTVIASLLELSVVLCFLSSCQPIYVNRYYTF